MTHSLTLGDLILTDSMPDDDHGYSFGVLADNMGFGVAQGVREVVASLLSDGDLVRTTRYGNREVSFAVQIDGPDLGSLAHGEAALRAEIGRRNTLTWQAPDVLAVPTVFDVVDSEMSQTFDDLDELRQRRTFVLTLTCSPFARSETPVTVDALPAGSSTEVVDACDSVSGWTAGDSTPPDAVSQSAGAVWVYDAAGGDSSMALRRAAPVDVSAHPLFVLEWKSHPGPGFTLLGLPAGSTQFPRELNRVALGDGWIRSTWLVEPGDLDDGFQFAYLNADSVTREGDFLGIREVRKSDTPPGQTSRQLARTYEVGGTERTPASIHVQTPTGSGSLGQCIVHTSPDDGSGYSPPLVRWRTAGSGISSDDPTTFSGKFERINTTSWVAEVPTSALPEGGYVLMARLRCQDADSTVAVTWSTSTIFPDSTTQEGFTIGGVFHHFEVANEWNFVKMDALTLPSVRTAAGKVQIALQVQAATPIVTLDEAWLFREDDDCALTIVESSQPHLWLESPGLDSPVPRVWIGGEEASKVHPGTGLVSMGAHVLSPGGTAVFTAALVENPATDATFYRRWHSNAAS